MAGKERRIRYLDAVVAVFATLLFVSPVLYLWTAPDTRWYLPYLLWLLVIVLAAWAWQQRSRHDL
jgi:hypothetical protein